MNCAADELEDGGSWSAELSDRFFVGSGFQSMRANGTCVDRLRDDWLAMLKGMRLDLLALDGREKGKYEIRRARECVAINRQAANTAQHDGDGVTGLDWYLLASGHGGVCVVDDSLVI